jgi:hypothetical protein
MGARILVPHINNEHQVLAGVGSLERVSEPGIFRPVLNDLHALAWPVGRLGEAIMGLARLHGWQLRSPEAPVCPAELFKYFMDRRQEYMKPLGVRSCKFVGVPARIRYTQ